MLERFCDSWLGDIERAGGGADGAVQINGVKYLDVTQTHVFTYDGEGTMKKS